jgi:hypothetical protein
MRAEPWPDETRHARLHSGVIIPPQPRSGMVQKAAGDCYVVITALALGLQAARCMRFLVISKVGA